MNKAIQEHELAWMPKSVWGPIKWKELHTRALSYLPMTNEEEWFKSFINSIPCDSCLLHFKSFIEINPPNFESRIEFFKWTVKAHNNVNISKGKKELTVREAVIEHISIFE